MAIADQLTGVVGHRHPHARVERVDDFSDHPPDGQYIRQPRHVVREKRRECFVL